MTRRELHYDAPMSSIPSDYRSDIQVLHMPHISQDNQLLSIRYLAMCPSNRNEIGEL